MTARQQGSDCGDRAGATITPHRTPRGKVIASHASPVSQFPKLAILSTPLLHPVHHSLQHSIPHPPISLLSPHIQNLHR